MTKELVTLYNYDPFSGKVQKGVFEFKPIGEKSGWAVLVEGNPEHWRGVTYFTVLSDEEFQQKRLGNNFSFRSEKEAAEHEINKLVETNKKDQEKIDWRLQKIAELEKYLD